MNPANPTPPSSFTASPPSWAHSLLRTHAKRCAMHFLFSIALVLLCLFAPLSPWLSPGAERWLDTSAILISFLLLTRWQLASGRQHPSSSIYPSQTEHPTQHPPILIVYASQTGYAEQLAQQTANTLTRGEMNAQLLDIADCQIQHLQQASQVLFIVSTTGEGDAPDSAAAFCQSVMHQTQALAHLRYAILALGDRHYQHFCAFGRELDHFLHQSQAQTWFDRVEVDNGDEGALRHWQHHLGVLLGHTELPDWNQSDYPNWVLQQRRLLNPGSLGQAVYLLQLIPLKSDLQSPAELTWQAGDIAEVLPCSADGVSIHSHREYSIASIPEDGVLELIVRQMHQADGSLGLGSGWLTQHAPIGATIALRIRHNRSFHAPKIACQRILIGNGTGMAGLRAHLKHAQHQQHHQHLLFFGERQRERDFFCQDELEQYLAQGHLAALHLAFSRDQEQRIYVQDRLLEQATSVQQAVQQGAYIYVCGSLEGMAKAVDQALKQILGETLLEQLRMEGRYRRDVY